MVNSLCHYLPILAPVFEKKLHQQTATQGSATGVQVNQYMQLLLYLREVRRADRQWHSSTLPGFQKE
jgi:hypothetical protein